MVLPMFGSSLYGHSTSSVDTAASARESVSLAFSSRHHHRRSHDQRNQSQHQQEASSVYAVKVGIESTTESLAVVVAQWLAD